MKQRLTCSVVIATYNGGEYILEQLESIANQTRIPDEIVVSDDCSTDNTFELVQSFAQSNKTINFIYKRNSSNIGFTKNFMRAIALSKADVIFFCDQDDIWNSKKIEYMMDCFEINNNIEALKCSKIDFISSDGLSKKSLNKPELKTIKEPQPVGLKSILKSFNCSGLTLAVKRQSYLDLMDGIISNNNGYDIIAGLYFSSKKTLFSLDCSLVFHRIHSSNATGKPKKRTKEFALKSIERKIQWLNASILICNGRCGNKELDYMRRAYNYYAKIAAYYKSNKIIRLFIKCLFPPRCVNYIYAVSNAYYLIFR